ncbi:MAG: gamma-glutamylcyclotransferase [Actinobacteria bacterium]|nr:gamma-glutamylcyclotransferase [Actinomycetota bacterium]
MTLMFLTGDGMRGGRLHHELRGAPLVAVTRTAARYRFYDVGGRYPALEPVPAGGYAIAGEVYDVPLAVLRDHLLPAEPAELELGIAELADGAAALAMLLRQGVPRPAGLTDISGIGDWRAYRGIS